MYAHSENVCAAACLQNLVAKTLFPKQNLAWVASLDYNATCQILPDLFYACFVVSKTNINLLHDSPLLKNICVRQAVLDKWFLRLVLKTRYADLVGANISALLFQRPSCATLCSGAHISWFIVILGRVFICKACPWQFRKCTNNIHHKTIRKHSPEQLSGIKVTPLQQEPNPQQPTTTRVTSTGMSVESYQNGRTSRKNTGATTRRTWY